MASPKKKSGDFIIICEPLKWIKLSPLVALPTLNLPPPSMNTPVLAVSVILDALEPNLIVPSPLLSTMIVPASKSKTCDFISIPPPPEIFR